MAVNLLFYLLISLQSSNSDHQPLPATMTIEVVAFFFFFFMVLKVKVVSQTCLLQTSCTTQIKENTKSGSRRIPQLVRGAVQGCQRRTYQWLIPVIPAPVCCCHCGFTTQTRLATFPGLCQHSARQPTLSACYLLHFLDTFLHFVPVQPRLAGYLSLCMRASAGQGLNDASPSCNTMRKDTLWGDDSFYSQFSPTFLVPFNGLCLYVYTIGSIMLYCVLPTNPEL